MATMSTDQDRSRTLHAYLLPALSLVLFLAAVWAIHSELAAWRLADVTAAIAALPAWTLAAAILAAALGYGFLALYDIMRTGPGDLSFPVHWAATAATSFVASPSKYREALGRAGFEVVHERDRGAFAREAFGKAQAAAATGELPPLGIHILMKTDVRLKLENVIRNVERGVIAPYELIGEAR